VLSILGMGFSYPDTVIDNAFLEGLGIESCGDWILEKIGIRARRTALPLDYIARTKNADPRQALGLMQMTPTQMGVQAGRMALERAGIEPGEVGLVLCNGCTPLTALPCEAQRIARGLGISVPAYDLQTGCPAFALHLDYLSNFMEEALPPYVLCVSTAAMTQKVSYADRSDSAILSDGAAAWVVSALRPGRLEVLESFFAADPRRWQAVCVETFGHFHQDGRAVRDFSVRQTVHVLKQLELRHQLDWSRDIFVGHQANATMLEQITHNRKIPAENHWHTVTELGNQAGAGAPAVLAARWEQIAPEQKIVVVLVGAGLSWGSLVLRGCAVDGRRA
jgi:3-oxoacyl-[acyl-carrier-protein] synthase III